MPLRPEQLTTKSAEAIQGAVQLAAQLSHQAVTPVHLLLVLIEQKDGLIPSLLQKVDKDPTQLSEQLKKRADATFRSRELSSNIPFTRTAQSL